MPDSDEPITPQKLGLVAAGIADLSDACALCAQNLRGLRVALEHWETEAARDACGREARAQALELLRGVSNAVADQMARLSPKRRPRRKGS